MRGLLIVPIESGQKSLSREDGVILPIDLDIEDAIEQFVDFYTQLHESDDEPSEEELINA